ncbi:putative extracellular exo-polygalacturonase [Clavulina sp. PMI_390]|nr:putative extracellular exo-polygalacturonase [Clavulina sp. PMI_390]
MLSVTPLLAIVFLTLQVLGSPAKRATCVVTGAQNAGTDDVPAITAALASCGNGGIIQISAGVTYAIRSVLDFSSCKSCDFQIEGTMKVSDDLTYWEGRRAIFYVNGVTGMTMRSVTGTGVVDGNGQAAWTEFAANSSYARPTLMYVTGSSSVTVTSLKFKNPPNVFHSVTGGSKSVTYSSLTMTAASDAGLAVPKNTDGFDVGSSSYVTISNVKVTNQDDCVAFKAGATYTTVSQITCTGSHGLSVGSLGSGSSADVVSNIYVTGATMVNSSKAVGIKLYDGESGHTAATVKNVTFDGVTVTNSDYAAQIQSCYGASTTAICTSNPSKSSVTDVYFKNFSGTTSTKYEPVITNLNCPSAGTCDIYISGWTVKSPTGSATYQCSNVDSSLGVTCSGAASG